MTDNERKLARAVLKLWKGKSGFSACGCISPSSYFYYCRFCGEAAHGRIKHKQKCVVRLAIDTMKGR